MDKRKLIIFLWSGVSFVFLASGLLASVAWFVSNNKFDVDITGSVVEEYFHCGDGTAGPDDPSTPNVIEGPFVITRPIHYYHLVEFFQRETALDTNAEFGSDYLYFQVGYDLDGDGDLEVYGYDDQGIYQGTYETPSYSQTLNMAYYSGNNALMPIGTNEVPFIGAFDGGAEDGITISNLNIHCAETVVVGNNTVNRAASDIGIFGYVADSDGSNPTIIENLKVDGLTIDLTDVTSTVASPTTSIAHTDAHAGVAYVGYIAGHVHSYTNYSSTGPVNATPLHDVYVTNATITGGAGTSCGFGYIGLVDTVDGEEPTTVESQVTTTHGSGGGQGDEWGGSIDFKEFNMRFYNNRSSFSYSTNKRLAKYSTDYTKTSLAYGSDISTNILGKNPTTSNDKIVYNLQGSGSHTIGGDTYTLSGTAVPFSINSSGQTLDGNTGYIVSSSRTTSGSANGSIRTASYRNGYLYNSLTDTGKTPREVYQANSLLTYNRTKTEILTNKNKTYKANGSGTENFVLIKDDMEGYNASHTPTNSYLSSYTKSDATVPGKTGLDLQKYNSSRTVLDGLLDSSVTRKVQGIHFMNATVAANQTETLPIVKINGKTYNNSSYPLLKNCVNFNVKTDGIINFFAGAYYDQTVNNQYVAKADCFFSLYTVDRNESTNAINSVKLISKIYKDTRASNKHIYQYSDSSYSASSDYLGDIVFDMQYLWSEPPVQDALYYFEIPVDAGEFALGGVSGQDGGAYLLYLDLSASASEQTQTHNQTFSIANASSFSQIDFQIATPVINSCFNVAFVIPNGATKETFSVTISSSSVEYNGEDYFCYEVVIVNTTQNDFVISALLMDDDDEPDNDYYYMYAIKYNTGARTEYVSSNVYTGVSGGTTMTPSYALPEQGEGD